MPVGLACLTIENYKEKFLSEINNPEHFFLKEILKHTFNSSKYLICGY